MNYSTSDIRHESHARSLNRLPEAAREKLLHLGEISDDALAVARAAADKYRALYDEHLRKVARLAEVEANPPRRDISDGGVTKIEAAKVAIEEAEAAVNKALLARDTQETLSASKDSAWQNARRLFDNVSIWTINTGGTFRQHPVQLDPKIVSKPGDWLMTQRAHIADLKAELRRVEAAPLPSSVAKDKARRQIEELALRARPNVSELVEGGGTINWPRNFQRVSIGADGAIPVTDAVGLLALLVPDALRAVVDAEIDAISDDKAALAPDARLKREAELSGEILEAERDEEAIAEACEAAGILIERRTDANPLAVLGVEVESNE